ncbi:IclR family transcriptional regulator [Pollutimonas bauzanensis]|uniref:IclR family transcriptional regulator n=1 Tax=Pollutimonas bauzanensis TaxID=658167 RepID=UPI00333EC7A3
MPTNESLFLRVNNVMGLLGMSGIEGSNASSKVEANELKSASTQVQGAQSVRRALSLLRLVGKYRDEGVKLAQLVRESELDRGTAYRLLTCLVEEQFVDRGSDNLYYLGPEAVLLGSLLSKPTPLLTRFLPVLRRIGRIAGDTVFLMMRQGDYIYCVHREEGSSMVKVLTTQIGQRRMIGTGTGGTAILEFMQPAEIKRIYESHIDEYQEQGVELDQLLTAAQEVRQCGYALTYDAFDEVGIAGLGIAFRIGSHGIGAISLATLTARLGPERLRELQAMLAAELKGLSLR